MTLNSYHFLYKLKRYEIVWKVIINETFSNRFNVILVIKIVKKPNTILMFQLT